MRPTDCNNPTFIRATGNEQSARLEDIYQSSQIKMEITPRQWFCFIGLQSNVNRWEIEVDVDYSSKNKGRNWVTIESYNKLKDKMCKRIPLDSTYFDIDVKNSKVMGHEGRHRALVAYDLGIEKIPVTFFVERGIKIKGKRKWSKIEVDEMTSKERRNLNKMLRHCLFAKKYRHR